MRFILVLCMVAAVTVNAGEASDLRAARAVFEENIAAADPTEASPTSARCAW